MTKNQSPKKAQNIKIKKDWSLDDPNFWSEMNTNMSKFKNNDQLKEQDDIKNILKMVIDMFDRLATPIKEIINMLPN